MPRPTMGGRPSVVRTLKRIRFLRGVPALDGDPQMNKNTINGAIGATFITNEGQKLLLDRELGDKLLDVRNIPSGAIYRIEHPETGDLVLPDTSWLENGLADGSLRLFSDATGKIAPERTLARVYDREYILKRDPYAEARLAVVLHLLKSGTAAHDPKLGAEIKKAWTADLQAKFGDQPDPATVRTWFGRVRDVPSAQDDGRNTRRGGAAGANPQVDLRAEREPSSRLQGAGPRVELGRQRSVPDRGSMCRS